MLLMSRIVRWTTSPAGKRTLFLLTTVFALLMACNPELLPLLPVVDALGLDVLAMLLGAQMLATLPWLRGHAGPALGVARRALAGIAAGAMGGYLRQLAFGVGRLGSGALFPARAG
ncbi:hypothetical protein IFT63_02465 [Stenotrophomonas sp. CFBP 13724]|uniref:hypothetical protein n=1 Tax=Stenotrophomonas sp. CFBP 13724 TaxID=2775298 RepID=UPI00177F1055|nr:hypothetical protein [Stenotrophomonas sp. CFBP 13724]MBD8642451.1 hypothetical protein [Stenotrophomonas sp. CFBP 13724]